MVIVAAVGCVLYQTASRWCMEVEKWSWFVLLCPEGSQSLGGAREFRLMRGKTVTSVNV